MQSPRSALSCAVSLLILAGCSTRPGGARDIAALGPTSPDPTLRQLETGRAAIDVLIRRRDNALYNLANVSTPGYRAQRLVQAPIVPGPEHAGGVRIVEAYLDTEQGSPIQGHKLDLMIDGPGFFQVELTSPDGPSNLAYTRAGRFTLNPDGEIVTIDGQHRLLPPLVVPGDAIDLAVESDGQVYVQLPGLVDLQTIGSIEIATFRAPQFLAAADGALFVETPRSGPPTLGDPATDVRGQIIQGYYECSNVDPEREALELRVIERTLALWGISPSTPIFSASAEP